MAGSEALVADLDDDFAAGVAVGDHPDQYGAVGDLGDGQFGQLRLRTGGRDVQCSHDALPDQEFRDPPEMAYLDTAAQGQIADHPDIVKVCAQVFDTLRAEALPPRASLDLIAKVRDTWT